MKNKEQIAIEMLMQEMEYVLSCINKNKMPFDGDDFHEALRLGKEALSNHIVDSTKMVAQQSNEQVEPVFWYKPYPNGMYNGPIHNAQIGEVFRGSEEWKPLYTTPPQRTWVRLSDDELLETYLKSNGIEFYKAFARSIEAKLREKNT